jgi:hypothetical protein
MAEAVARVGAMKMGTSDELWVVVGTVATAEAALEAAWRGPWDPAAAARAA